jgi:glutaredoxin
MHAVIYTKDHCPYCTRAKALFHQKGITYEEKIIPQGEPDSRKLTESQSWTTREELLSAAPNAKTVPQIWLDGNHIGGHDDLVKFLG